MNVMFKVYCCGKHMGTFSISICCFIKGNGNSDVIVINIFHMDEGKKVSPWITQWWEKEHPWNVTDYLLAGSNREFEKSLKKMSK